MLTASFFFKGPFWWAFFMEACRDKSAGDCDCFGGEVGRPKKFAWWRAVLEAHITVHESSQDGQNLLKSVLLNI